MARLRVRKVAEQKGFRTAGALARESRVSYGTVHAIWNTPEAVESSVSLGILNRLAEALGVTVAELIEETELAHV